MSIEEVKKVVADLTEWMEAAYPLRFAHTCVVIGGEESRLCAYLGQGDWHENVTDDRFADAAFRLRTRIAAEYLPEAGEAA